MRIRTTVLAFSIVALLAACKDKDAAAPVAATPDATPPAEPAAPPPPPSRFRGQAIMGKDGYGMTICGDPQQKIVTFSPDAQAALDKFIAGGAKEFFLDGWGTNAPDGHPQIDVIERIYSEGPGCDEKDISMSLYRARGNEPFWSVDVSPTGVVLERPDNQPLTMEYQPLEKLDGGVRRFVNETPPNGKFELTLTPGLCSDGMSDTVYGFNATAKIGTEEYKGCGFSGLVSE
jgi:putative lipoprotein